jgi:hypothetical protein
MQEEQQERCSSVKGEEARQKKKAMRKEWQHESMQKPTISM